MRDRSIWQNHGRWASLRPAAREASREPKHASGLNGPMCQCAHEAWRPRALSGSRWSSALLATHEPGAPGGGAGDHYYLSNDTMLLETRRIGEGGVDGSRGFPQSGPW